MVFYAAYWARGRWHFVLVGTPTLLPAIPMKCLGPGLAGVLFAHMTPGSSVPFQIGSSSTFSSRWSRCPGATAAKPKETDSPSPRGTRRIEIPHSSGAKAYIFGDCATAPFHSRAITLQTKDKDVAHRITEQTTKSISSNPSAPVPSQMLNVDCGLPVFSMI